MQPPNPAGTMASVVFSIRGVVLLRNKNGVQAEIEGDSPNAKLKLLTEAL
jgi:hypothetical protein